MKILNRIIEDNIAIFLVESKGKELQNYFPEAYEKIKGDVELKGFRKGKVPLDLFLKKFDKSYLYSHAAEILTNEMYKNILKDNKDLNFISTPDIEIKEFDPQKKILIEFKIFLKPKVVLPDIKDINLKKEKEIEVTDEEIKNEIDKYLNKYSYMKVIDGPAKKGDIVVIDYIGYINGKKFNGGNDKNYQLQLGSQTFIPGFEEKLIGLKEGESKNFDIVFPEDYFAKDLQGKKATFDIVVNAVKEKITPNLNIDFIRDLNIEGVNTEEEFKNFLKHNIIQIKKKNNIENRKKEILTQLIDKTLISIPEKIIQQQYESSVEKFENSFKKSKLNINDYYKMYNTTEKKFKEDLKNDIIRTIKTQFILEKLIIDMDIKLTKDEEKDFYNKNPKVKNNEVLNEGLYNLKINKALDKLMEKLVVKNESR